MKKHHTDEKDLGIAAKAASAMLSRRRLLKAGAATAPVVLTLQSGTAWAQSLTCVDKQVFPVLNEGNEEALQQLLASYGADPNLIYDFNQPGYNGSEGHMIYLQAEAASCYASIATI